MKHLKEKKLFKQKRTWVVIAMVAVLVGLITVVMAGYARQQTIFGTSNERHQNAKSLVATVFNGRSTQGQRLAAIARLTEIESGDNCKGDWWNGWQQSLLPSMKDMAVRCEKQQQAIQKVVMAARQTQDFLQYDKAVAQQMAALAIDTTKQNWPLAALKSAQEARISVKGTRTPKGGEASQRVTLGCLDAIISSWNALNAASAKQDKTAYLNAEAELKQAYANLGATADASDAGISSILDLLKKEASKL